MTSHEPRRSALQSVPAETLGAVRIALARCLSSAPDAEVAEAFRQARLAAHRDGVPPARLVEIILSTWGELAEAVSLAPERRADELSEALARCLEAVLDSPTDELGANAARSALRSETA